MADEHKGGAGAVGGVVAALGLLLAKGGGACAHAAAPMAEVGVRAGSQAARLAGEGALLGAGGRALSKGGALAGAGEHALQGARGLEAGAHLSEEGAHAGALVVRAGEHEAGIVAPARALGGAAEHPGSMWETLIEQAPDLLSNATDLFGDDDDEPAPPAALLQRRVTGNPPVSGPGWIALSGPGAPVDLAALRARLVVAAGNVPVGVAAVRQGQLVALGGSTVSEAALHRACLEAGARCLVLTCAPGAAGCLEQAAAAWRAATPRATSLGDFTWRLSRQLSRPEAAGLSLSYVSPDDARVRHVERRPAR